MKSGLFVYGTLHPDRAPGEIRGVVERLASLGEGSVAGKLLDLGEYPGLILHGEQQVVRGEVFAFADLEMLAAIDAYEGYDEADLEGSLFVRRLLTVTMADGRLEEHWVYVYNGDQDRAR